MFYSKEPKSVTAFYLLKFFRADLIQSETSWKLPLTFGFDRGTQRQYLFGRRFLI